MIIKINIKDEREKALLFLQRKNIIHVTKLNGIFHNGLILEVGDEFFVLLDRIHEKEVFILFKELKHPLDLFKEDTR